MLWRMIRGFRHKGLEAFYRTGSKAGIQPHHGNWRLIFRFDGEDAVLVDYRDYH